MDVTERKQAEEKLKENEASLRFAQIIGKMGSWDLDIQTRNAKWSENAFHFYGFNPLEVVPSLELFTNTIHPEDVNYFNEMFAKIISDKKSIGFECRVFIKDNSIRWIQNEVVPIMNGDNLVKLQGSFFDITDRKQAEEKILDLNRDLELRVKQRTSELEAVNKELETFSYSISHDLKAPLRHISGFIALFLENKPKDLSKEQLEFLEVISSSASDMGKLIDAILNFSRLNSYELRKTRIRSSKMVQQVIAFFEPEIQNRKITFNVESLPEVNGDEELILQVWTNLISNAVKYTMKKPEAVVEIGSISNDNEITFYIKDNGAGFKMKYAERLFGVFQRLHKTCDFEGIGIGLANVNRIVTRHGGHCRAEGEVDKGATFYFSLPK